MLLRDLLAPWFPYAGEQTFQDLTLDSRAIRRGDVFLALPLDTRSMVVSLSIRP